MPQPNTLAVIRERINAALAQEQPSEVDLLAIQEALDDFEAQRAGIVHCWPVALREPESVEMLQEGDGYMFPTLKVTMPNGAWLAQCIVSAPDEDVHISPIGQGGPWMDYLQKGDPDSFGYVNWAHVDLAMEATLVAVQNARVARDRAADGHRAVSSVA